MHLLIMNIIIRFWYFFFTLTTGSFRSKEEVEKEFQEYKTATEQSRGDEKEELEKLKAELAERKKQHQYETEQLEMQV